MIAFGLTRIVGLNLSGKMAFCLSVSGDRRRRFVERRSVARAGCRVALGRGLPIGAAAALIAAACVASGLRAADIDWSKVQTVTVVTIDDEFQPKQLKFRRGVPYRLHVENHGKDLHEFNAVEMFKVSLIRNPEVLDPDRTEIVLQPGDKKDLYFVPEKAGKFPLVCPNHDWDDMLGEITVK